jgi:hypothetical protein
MLLLCLTQGLAGEGEKDIILLWHLDLSFEWTQMKGKGSLEDAINRSREDRGVGPGDTLYRSEGLGACIRKPKMDAGN